MKHLRHLVLALALLAPLPAAPAAAQAGNYLPGVGAVAVTAGGGAVTLAIPGKAGAPYRVMWLSSPYRLVVDLQGHWLGAPKSSIWIGGGLVTQIRAARHASGVTRIVFDLTAPADVRADNQGGTMVLTVVPRGAATGALPYYQAPTAAVPTPRGVYPAYPGYPVPNATRRPIPAYPGYPYGYAPPVARVTPLPVMPPMGWMPPPPNANPNPYPQPMNTPAPMPMNTPPPMPMNPDPGMVQPPVAFSPEPVDPGFGQPEMPMGPRPVFGNRVYVGGGGNLSFSETYTAGNYEVASTPFMPRGEFGWDQLFTDNLGVSLGARAQGYKVENATVKAAGGTLLFTRDELDAHLGLHSRWELGPVELMVRPQAVVRNVSASANLTPPGGSAAPFTNPGYGGTSYLAYGGGAGLGLGYRILEWLAVDAGGEFNYLLGSSTVTEVSNTFPLMNIRAGGGLRLDFGPFGTTLGYKLNMLNGGASYSQSSSGPYLNFAFVY